MEFEYVAYTGSGERVKGSLDAAAETGAEEILWSLGYTIVTLREKRGSSQTIFGIGMRIKADDLVVFSRQLATLIESGISLTRSLELLETQIGNKRFRGILIEIIADLQQGHYFSEAIAKQGQAFPMMYARLVEVGERTGGLEQSLLQLADYIEKETALVRKIRSAMAYPAFVLFMAVAVIVLMLTVALPPLMGLFESFGAELPIYTRILMALTNFVTDYRLEIIAVVVAVAATCFFYFRSATGKYTWARMMVKIPIIKRVTINGAVARICNTMAILLKSGLALPEIIDLCIRTQGNLIIKGALESVKEELLQGKGLADPLAEQELFPQMLVQMVRVGEETGALDSNMATLAVFYDQDVDRTVNAMSGMIEPALTILVGGMTGFIALSVMGPIYSLMSVIK